MPVVQTQRAYLLVRHLTGLYSMQLEAGAISRVATVVEFVAASLAFQQSSTPQNFPLLNLKGFRDERRVEHLVPNQVLGFFEFFGERERGRFSVFKGLQEPLSAQIPKKLKMRRLPPTIRATIHCVFSMAS